MNGTKRTYRMKPSWWLCFFYIGPLCLVIVFVTLGNAFADIEAGVLNLLEYLVTLLVLLFLVVGMLPFGVLCLIVPFIIKVVLSEDGIEYNTLAGSLQATWDDIDGAIYHPPGRAGLPIKLDCTWEVRLRWWTKYAPWNARQGLIDQGIPLHFFGKRLISDLRERAPYLKL